MPNRRKKLRNVSLVEDHDNNGLSFGKLAQKYNIARSTACEVYKQEKGRDRFADLRELSRGVIHNKINLGA